MRRVMVVGGPNALVFGNFARKLALAGVEVTWHATDFHGEGPGYTGIPAGCEGVIVLREMVSHLLHGKAHEDAKTAGVPYAFVSRKWSAAESTLRATGVLAPAASPVRATPVQIVETAFGYIVSQRENGRIPKMDEVEAALQRAYGMGIQFTRELFTSVSHRAAAEVPLKAPPPPEDFSEAVKVIEATAGTLIEENPAVVQDRTALLVKVMKRFPKGTKAPPNAKQIVDAVVEGHLSLWKSDRVAREMAAKKWLEDWLRRAIKTGQDWPIYGRVLERSKPIFGVVIKWPIMREARTSVLGDWARDLIGEQAANEHLVSKGLEPLDLTAAIKDGIVQGIKVGHKRPKAWTSKVALDAYIAAKTPPLEIPALPDAATLAKDILGKMGTLLAPLHDRLGQIEARLAALEARPCTDPTELARLREEVRALGDIEVVVTRRKP